MTHFDVDIELMNRADEVLIDDSIRNLPSGYDSSISEIRQLAEEGNQDAQYIVRKAREGNETAKDYAGSRFFSEEHLDNGAWVRDRDDRCTRKLTQ